MTDQPRPKLQLSDDEWRKRLSPAEYRVLRQTGTEPPFTGSTPTPKPKACTSAGPARAELFRSTEKFESHCGWPSFFDPADTRAVILRPDASLGMRRVEVLCANCHSHLGHVFTGEGYPTPTDGVTASTRFLCVSCPLRACQSFLARRRR